MVPTSLSAQPTCRRMAHWRKTSPVRILGKGVVNSDQRPKSSIWRSESPSQCFPDEESAKSIRKKERQNEQIRKAMRIRRSMCQSLCIVLFLLTCGALSAHRLGAAKNFLWVHEKHPSITLSTV